MTYCISFSFFEFSEWMWYPLQCNFTQMKTFPYNLMGRPFFYACFYLTQAVSISFCTTLHLKLRFYWPLSYNSIFHCPLLQSPRTKSAILASAQSYILVESFKCEEKNSCYDLIPILVYNS
jgi:hypothetical protein